MVEYIKKRDGSIQKFLPEKIEFAIYRALKSVNIDDLNLAIKLTKDVIERIDKEKIPNVEEIQDIVERVLVENGLFDAAKSYILYREKRKQIRESKKILGIEDKLKLSVNSINVLRKRYLLRNEKGEIIETPEEMFRRVAKHVASCEKDKNRYEEEFFNIMANLEFLPNSPTLMNAGTPLGQLSACFVLPVDDSIDGIFTTLKNMALIHKSGGGTGFSFSNLRPKGDIVGSTKGVASGPVSFMEIYDKATEIVKQGGKRRGANMGILSYNHPDIYEFITSKRKNILTNFNISVSVSDEFMEKVIKREKYYLINPRNGEKVREVYANEVFDLICYCAWEVGDPGIIYIDEINRHNPTPEIGKIESTNPCVTGDTFIFTEDGLVEAKDLKEGMKVWSGKNWNRIEKVIDNGVKKILKLTLESGIELKVTEEHKIFTEEGWKEAKNIEIGDKVYVCLGIPELPSNNHREEIDFYELLGYFTGDGALSASNHFTLHVGEDENLLNHFSPILKKYAGYVISFKRGNQYILDVHRKNFAEKIRELFNLEISDISKIRVPEKIVKNRKENIKGYLRGLFSADGSVYDGKGTVTISLSSTSKILLQQVQNLLLFLGIPSTLTYEKKNSLRCIKGQIYKTKKNYRLILTGEKAVKFFNEIGFIGKKREKFLSLIKNKRIYDTLEKYEFQKVVKKEYYGEERVFDIKAPEDFTWITNGVLSLDCGEQPLLPYESCNLGSINLTKIVENGEINWEKLERIIEISVRFLDNVIDVNEYPLEEIEKMTKGNRKIGLGVMGWADLLLELKIPYGSKESLELAEKLMKFISEKALKYSVLLGREKGSFPNFEKSIYYKKFDSLRNATRTTIAPTGSISIIANCSSGIEPIFGVAFIRNILEGTKFVEINPVFEKFARKDKILTPHILKEIIKTGSLKNIKEIPDEYKKIFLTALDIPPIDHLKMQSVFQKYTDNAVSKTVNLPYDATIEDVKEIFINGWKMKCKGVTVFRYGSKGKQVLSFSDSSEEIDYLTLTDEISSCSKGVCFY